MYIPSSMKIESVAEMQAFMQAFSFGTLVSAALEATSLPFMLRPEEGEYGTLYAHFARANRHWQGLEGQRVLILFNGPHAYISPRWYAQTPAVPTWNYAAVHAYGTAAFLDDAQTSNLLEETVQHYEASLLHDRQIVTEEIQAKLRAAVVGFKITLTELQGKLKLGQHRQAADQQGVVAGLQAQAETNSEAAELLRYMRQKQIGTG